MSEIRCLYIVEVYKKGSIDSLLPPCIAALSLAFALLTVFALFVTTRDVYVRHSFKISFAFSVVLCALSLLATANLRGGGSSANSASCPSSADSASSGAAGAAAVATTHMFPGDVSPAGLYAIYLAITLLVRHR